jgi:FkbM family methyltransferase
MSKYLSNLIGALPVWLTDWVLRRRDNSRTLKRLIALLTKSLRNKEVAIGQGVGKGLFINVGDSAASYGLGTFKPDLQTFLNSTVWGGSVFYDVGANVGFFSLIAARLVGPLGKVISFEPLPANLVNLQENVRRNEFRNVQIVPMALGAANEEQAFQVSERPTWGKLGSIGAERPDKYITDIKVVVRRLDDLLREGVIQPPDFVKIDVEGAEVAVIEGAKELLLRYGPTLMIELHGTGSALTSIFATIGYCALPLSAAFDNVAQAHWNAMILAFPSHRVESIASARQLLQA